MGKLAFIDLIHLAHSLPFLSASDDSGALAIKPIAQLFGENSGLSLPAE